MDESEVTLSCIPLWQDPLFLEKFCIKDIVPSEITEESDLEFQVYSSHHVSRRHLVGVGSVRLMDVEHFPGGQVELVITPQTVYRVRSSGGAGSRGGEVVVVVWW